MHPFIQFHWPLGHSIQVFTHYLDGLQNNFGSNSLGKNTTWSDCVDEFDVDAYADSAAATGARYAVITMMQGAKFMLGPNARYDNLTGCVSFAFVQLVIVDAAPCPHSLQCHQAAACWCKLLLPLLLSLIRCCCAAACSCSRCTSAVDAAAVVAVVAVMLLLLLLQSVGMRCTC
jgi:hypothetical protein